MNKCLETTVLEPPEYPFFVPVPDRDGWYSESDGQSSEQLDAYFQAQARERREHIVERFEAAVAESKADPGWLSLSNREKVAKLLARAGFQAKAERYVDCQVTGIPVDCVACGEKYHSRYRCTLRFCELCGPWHFSRLMEKYRQPISDLIYQQKSQRGRTLARLNFTVRACDQMPHPSESRRLLKLVRKWFKRMMPRGVLWGCVFAVEVGHELAVKHPGRKAGGWNLHVHALYYGPFLDWDRGLGLWKELTEGEGQGFYIKQCEGWRTDPGRAVRRALVHHFGYIMKPAGVSPERIAGLEVLFSGVRRVHALGCFYKLPKPEKEIANARCPKCGWTLPINLRAWKRSERQPVSFLEAEGRRDFRQLESQLRRARVLNGDPP